jgi:hypothetical protein
VLEKKESRQVSYWVVVTDEERKSGWTGESLKIGNVILMKRLVDVPDDVNVEVRTGAGDAALLEL